MLRLIFQPDFQKCPVRHASRNTLYGLQGASLCMPALSLCKQVIAVLKVYNPQGPQCCPSACTASCSLLSLRGQHILFQVQAADIVQQVGIGRNEYIAIMNKCKAKKLLWRVNKSIAKEFLPVTPLDINTQPWWAVGIVNLSRSSRSSAVPPVNIWHASRYPFCPLSGQE